MHTRSRQAALVGAAVGAMLSLGSHLLVAQSNDPLAGKWRLDVDKSTFAGAKPTKRIMMFTIMPNGVTQTITTTTAGAAEVTYNLVYTAKFDGKDYPADVASSFNTVSMKRLDARRLERIGKVKGQIVETETYMVSPNGRTMTVKQEGENNGVPFKTSQVFERE